MPAKIPARVAPPLPKNSKDDQGAPRPCNPMDDIFDPDCSDWSSCNDSEPDPLKRRQLKKKKWKQGSLADCLTPHPEDNHIYPAEEQGDDFRPAVIQGEDTCPAVKQGNTTTHPVAKPGMKPRPVDSLPMSITGWLPCPLGKTPAIHTIHLLQWYDECETMDPWFVEVVSTALATLATDRTPEQHVVLHQHQHAERDAQTPLFHVEEMPNNF